MKYFAYFVFILIWHFCLQCHGSYFLQTHCVSNVVSLVSAAITVVTVDETWISR